MLQLVAHSPGSAEAHHRLGRVLQLQGRLNEAEACFRRALELDPDYVGALIGLGTIEAARGEPRSALKRFEMAIEIEPHDAEAHFARARVLDSMGKTDEALARLLPNPRIQPACILRSAGASARSSLRETSPIRPWSGSTRRLTSLPTMARSTCFAAVRTCSCGMLLRPSSTSAWPPASFPGRADVHYQLALALEAAHMKTEALKAAETALRLAPNYADARDLSERLRR